MASAIALASAWTKYRLWENKNPDICLVCWAWLFKKD
jgi:hypothetical protein